MPTQLQVTKITKNGRISLGKVIPAMNAQIGDVIQIVMNDDGSFKISRVEA